MYRKFFAVLLACVLLMTLFTSCNGKSKPLTECGEEVISLMAEMLESEDYKSLYNIPSAYDDQVKRLREGDYSKSIAVYELLVSEEELLGKTIDKDGLSKELYEYICSSAYVSFASHINQLSGVEDMAVSAVFTAQKSYSNKDVDTNRIYLYVFENGCPIAVTFVVDGNDSLRAVGHFIMNDKFITEDENSIKESGEVFGINDVTVKKQ